MLITATEQKGVRIITLCPRIDIHNVFQVEEEVMQLISPSHLQVVIDFSKVEYFGSNGIRIVMLAKRTLEGMGGTLVLAALNQFVIKILKAIDLLELFVLKESVEAAVNDISSNN